jgi:hypothetical protein
MIRCCVLVGMAIASAPATAQQFGDVLHVHLQLSWHEVDALTGLPVASPNGVLEPGEGARVMLSASFSPPVGGMVPSPPALGPDWTVRGLYSTDVELRHSLGTWSHMGTGAHWTNIGGWPFANGLGYLIHIRQPEDVPDQSNPVIAYWHGVWTPSVYQPGVANFQTRPWGIAPMLNAFLVLDAPSWPGGLYPGSTTLHHHQITIPVVPSPGAGVLFVVGAMGLLRRRR